jgi:hypothetical protein
MRPTNPLPLRPRPSVLAALVAIFVTVAGVTALRGSAKDLTWRTESHPQTSWAKCNRNAGSPRVSTFVPLSDAAAAALVTPEPEVRPDNSKPYTLLGRAYPAPNYYVPSSQALRAFLAAKVSTGQSQLQFNPYYKYVDGRDGIRSPTTDDLIQWAAHKWGIPEDWLRAEFVLESYWNAFMLGDKEPVSAAQYGDYPEQARLSGSQVYQSMGITQIRWQPGGALHPGTEPLRWESTAFNLDYQAATIRFYYDDPQGSRSRWGDKSYKPCENWNSIGAWYSPYPWQNPGQSQYLTTVQHDLSDRAWRSSDFNAWSPASLPPGIKLR